MLMMYDLSISLHEWTVTVTHSIFFALNCAGDVNKALVHAELRGCPVLLVVYDCSNCCCCLPALVGLQCMS
jgi:hypothetical protein